MAMQNKLIWVGPKESDTLYCGLDFFRSVTFNGSNQGINTAFTSMINTRIDHISDGAKWKLSRFLQNALCPFLEDPDVRFLFYNPAQGLGLGSKIASRIICANPAEMLDYLRSKAHMREFAQKYVPVVPYVHFVGNRLPSVQFGFKTRNYILQVAHSSSGAGTYQFSQEECMDFLACNPENEEYILSPYLERSVPINVHIVIFNHQCVVLPPSIQLVSHQDQTFCYLGADFHAHLTCGQLDLIMHRAKVLGEGLQAAGFRGVCGIDFMLTEDELYFLEINPRFQASSFLCNKLLAKEGKPSLHVLNMMAFADKDPPLDSFSAFRNPESFFTLYGDWFPTWIKDTEENAPSNAFEIIKDGLSSDMTLTSKAYLCRVITCEKLCWIDPDFRLRIAPNIQRDSMSWRTKVQAMDPLTLKIGLLNQGIRFSVDANQEIERLGSVRAGVFQSIDLTFPNGLIINSPYCTKFSGMTPYCVELGRSGFLLSYEGVPLSPVTLPVADHYRNRVATGGTYYRHAAFLATDRLRIHHELRCRFKENGLGCRFCNVRLKTGPFSIPDVCEVIDFYLSHVQFNHFLIGGGSGSAVDERNNILAITRHIRSRTGKPIYAMCLPPQDVSVLSEYHEAGIDEIGFNLELFDRALAAQLMPGKGTLPISQYENAYKEAVRLWGRRGAVRSLMVLGLESTKSFYRGLEWLCNLGVMPIISVFRPMESIELSQVLPPENKELEVIFRHSKEIASKYGLTLGPTCTACQNNTLSLPL